jgi:hypothetical protein
MPESDLPKLSAPARRALAAGITTLAELAKLTERELLQQRAAMEERDLSFA